MRVEVVSRRLRRTHSVCRSSPGFSRRPTRARTGTGEAGRGAGAETGYDGSRPPRPVQCGFRDSGPFLTKVAVSRGLAHSMAPGPAAAPTGGSDRNSLGKSPTANDRL